VQNQLEQERERKKQERHKAKLEAIASKTKDRKLPYGLNYSKAKETIEIPHEIKYESKKETNAKINRLERDKPESFNYLKTVSKDKQTSRRTPNKRKLLKMSTERLGNSTY